MKRSILLVFVFSSVLAFSQNSAPVVVSFKTYGYVGGIRLDSIDAQFAEFSANWIKEIRFDYGQWRQKSKELTITDSQGTPLIFELGSTAFLLNFFYYNGWVPAPRNNDSSISYPFILTKKQGRN